MIIKIKFTGDDLGIKVHFLNRDHGWSTTKFKINFKKLINYVE